MSHAVRHSLQPASDPGRRAGEVLLRGSGDERSEIARSEPAPIEISPADMLRAFDLFEPEPGTSPEGQSEPENGFAREPQPPTVVPFADGQFARQIARVLDAPQPARSLPLGGIGPTDREIASARALMVGWIAALAIAAFAFLAQGPSVTPRSPSETEAPPPAVEAPGSTAPGDIRLVAPSEKPARARKTARAPAPAGQPKP